MNKENQSNTDELNSDAFSEQKSFEDSRFQSYRELISQKNSESVSVHFYESVLLKIQERQSTSQSLSLKEESESNLKESFLLSALLKKDKSYLSEVLLSWKKESTAILESQKYSEHISEIQSEAERIIQKVDYVADEVKRENFLSLEESEIDSESVSAYNSTHSEKIQSSSEEEIAQKVDYASDESKQENFLSLEESEIDSESLSAFDSMQSEYAQFSSKEKSESIQT